jgi:hypothetical protein
MTCPELIDPQRSMALIRFERYTRLHREGRSLIQKWFRRSMDMWDCQGEECFEAFCFLWFAFNAWATCVSSIDIDRAYIAALMRNQAIGDDFERLCAIPDSRLASQAAQFAKFWPIFEVRSLRRQGIARPFTSATEREEIIRQNFSLGMLRFDPPCGKRHMDAGEHMPIDWPHTLSALYRVRCNLFHGEKAPDSEIDQQIVSSAFHTLLSFLEMADCFYR